MCIRDSYRAESTAIKEARKWELAALEIQLRASKDYWDRWEEDDSDAGDDGGGCSSGGRGWKRWRPRLKVCRRGGHSEDDDGKRR